MRARTHTYARGTLLVCFKSPLAQELTLSRVVSVVYLSVSLSSTLAHTSGPDHEHRG